MTSNSAGMRDGRTTLGKRKLMLQPLADLIARDYADRKILAFCPLRATSRRTSLRTSPVITSGSYRIAMC